LHYKIPISITLFLFMAVGCVTIPRENIRTSRRDDTRGIHALPCDPAKGNLTPPTSDSTDSDLDAGGISVAVWNMMKGAREGWQGDFMDLLENNDLLVVQEAYLTEAMQSLMQTRGLVWDMVPAFEINGIPAGVMTASHATPDFLCTIKIEEPLLKTPKTTLITRYPLSGTDQTLMVVNLHLVNFTPGFSDFQNQLTRIHGIASKHAGPMILAGDFNTWSDQRLGIVREFVHGLGLKPVVFDKDNRRKFFGHYVDHIYYRNLEPVDARVIPVTTSDHNPMVVHFRIHD
jgi:endonuclease/exonuclease/phosphatase (EEP) superfamily protein YafD